MTEYYMLPSTGNDGNGGTSETDAVKTFAVAKGLLSPGDKLWVKAEIDITVQDGATNAILQVNQSGGSTTPIYIEGYHTSEGDGGLITLDAAVLGLNYCVTADTSRHSWGFRNIQFIGASSACVSDGTSNNWLFINSSFEDSSGKGIYLNDNHRFINCRIKNTASYSIDIDNNSLLINCIVHDSINKLIYINNGLCYNCLVYDPGANNEGLRLQSPDSNISEAINCICDGDNESETSGIYITNSSGANVAIINSVAYDENWGMRASNNTAALYEWMHAEHNAYYENNQNTSYMQSVANQEGSFTASSDPFALPDGSPRDYRPKPGSELKMAGTDVADTIAFWNSFDDGDNPPVSADEEYVSAADIGCIQSKPIRRRTIARRIQ